MNAAARLGVYAAGLAVVFTGAFATAGAVVPEEAVQTWTQQAEGAQMDQHTGEGQDQTPAEPASDSHAGHAPQGVSMEQNGYLLQEVTAPGTVGDAGELSLTITGPDGAPVTEFETSHERQMHLIFVRTDGTEFRHVHPVMDAAGRWSLVTVSWPLWWLTSTPVTPATSWTSSRTDISQCPQVIPVTWN